MLLLSLWLPFNQQTPSIGTFKQVPEASVYHINSQAKILCEYKPGLHGPMLGLSLVLITC